MPLRGGKPAGRHRSDPNSPWEGGYPPTPRPLRGGKPAGRHRSDPNGPSGSPSRDWTHLLGEIPHLVGVTPPPPLGYCTAEPSRRWRAGGEGAARVASSAISGSRINVSGVEGPPASQSGETGLGSAAVAPGPLRAQRSLPGAGPILHIGRLVGRGPPHPLLG